MSREKYFSSLQATLAACHAGVYGYPIIAAQSSGAQRADALRRATEVKQLRDELSRKLAGLGQTPVAALAGYALPSGATKDLRLIAQVIEGGLAAAAAGLVANCPAAERLIAADWLSEATLAGYAWGTKIADFPGLKAAKT